MRVFADAFFYVALVNRHDAYHARVAEFAQTFSGGVLTTEWVLTEVADALATSQARRQVCAAFRALAMDSGTSIVGASSALFSRGLELYEKRADKAWSLTDCISLVVMTDEGVHEALTGDRHFVQAGFVPIFANE